MTLAVLLALLLQVPAQAATTAINATIRMSIVKVDTPAVLTIQTGINAPRYANLRAIKQAEQVEIAVVGGETGEPAYRVRRMFTPPRGAGAEMLDGGAASVAGRIVEIVRERLG